MGIAYISLPTFFYLALSLVFLLLHTSYVNWPETIFGASIILALQPPQEMYVGILAIARMLQ